jgi:transcriptional regulator with XRE-family HTH domain
MKLGDVLKKERERRRLGIDDVCTQLGLSQAEYQELETGESGAEEWGPRLGKIAIKLATPTSRLISKSGKATGSEQEEGQCGKLIKTRREEKEITREDLAAWLNVPTDQVATIENGQSGLEKYGPILLRFAEVIDQPIFNLFYPCGLPLEELEDYT